jgi:hypothetical protein
MSIRAVFLIATPTLVIYIAILGLMMLYLSRIEAVPERADAIGVGIRPLRRAAEAGGIADTTADFIETVGPVPDDG